MRYEQKMFSIVTALAVVVSSFSTDAKAAGAKNAGLIGAQYAVEDFTNLQNLSRFSSLDRAFAEDDD